MGRIRRKAEKFSITRLAEVTGYSRPAIKRRADLFGYEPKKIVHLAPLTEDGSEDDKTTLQEARTKQALADAELKEIQKQKLEGQLADAGEMVEKVTELANAIEKIIRGSNLEEERKADIYSAIRDAAKDWSS